MKKLMYLCGSRFEKLNEYEKEHKRVSYRTLLDYYDISCILCNNIVNVDECLFDNIITGEIDENTEIFQYYIINASEWDIENIQEKYSDELIICYSEQLENYILCVDHFGTSWDYVLTDIEWTTDLEEYNKWEENLLLTKDLE